MMFCCKKSRDKILILKKVTVRFFISMCALSFSCSSFSEEKGSSEDFLKMLKDSEATILTMCYSGLKNIKRYVGSDTEIPEVIKDMASMYFESSVVAMMKKHEIGERGAKNLVNGLAESEEFKVTLDFLAFCKKGGVIFNHAQSLIEK